MAPRILYGLGQALYEKIFPPTAVKKIAAVCEVLPIPVTQRPNREWLVESARRAEIVVSGWDTPMVDAAVLAASPGLKLVAHAAGSIKPMMSPEAWQRGVRVTGASSAIAIGVAEFCVAMMLTAAKRVYWFSQRTRQGHWNRTDEAYGPALEIYHQKVGIIGASQVGRHLIKLLQSFDCEVLVYDPYWTRERLQALGARKVDTVDEIFTECRVVSLNAPTTKETEGMIRGRHFAMLREGSVFVNTARGILINQDEMVEQLRRGRFVACIDVTTPEPLPVDHPLRTLPNVILTPHEAGAMAENLMRIGEFIADEVERYAAGAPLVGEVKQSQLDTIA
ncbi:MAG TPA: hydroxyacid dehydrogenase [Spirochaetia bacterium]|nr:hydroxyacid dehydrogenase [Spirochaetia bacterium]